MNRIDFARAVTLILTIATSAIDRALDLKKNDPTDAEVMHFTDAIREALLLIEGREPSP